MIAFSKTDVEMLAIQYGWWKVQDNYRSRVLGFCRGVERINVYYTTGTVGTCTNHPVQGHTQLFRRNVSWQTLATLFMEVRSHTGQGYYRRVALGAPEPQLASRGWNGSSWIIDDLDSTDANDTPLIAIGSTWLSVSSDGSTSWGSGIPKLLDNKLRGRQKTPPPVDVLAFGPCRDSYDNLPMENRTGLAYQKDSRKISVIPVLVFKPWRLGLMGATIAYGQTGRPRGKEFQTRFTIS